MASLRSFTFGVCNATRWSSTVPLSSRFRTVAHFSTWGKSPPAEREPPHEANPTETASSRADRQSPQKPLPVEKSSPEQNLRKKFWRIFRTNVPEPSKEEFRSLRNDDFPREKGRFRKKIPSLERTDDSEILFGISPCLLALERSRRSFFQMFLKAKRESTSPAVEQFSQYAEERGIPVKMVKRAVLDVLCKHGVHQGVCLEVTPLRPIDWQDGLSDEVPCAESQSLWLALEGIKDPMNLGAVLRSAHFLGVDGIVMTRRNSCPLTPVVSKASSGAMEVLDVFHTADLQSFLKHFGGCSKHDAQETKSEHGWEILGTTGHGKTEDDTPLVNSLDFCWTRPSVLVLGSEGDGLSPETRRLCHRMLTISPGRKLPPGIESLNVSVAAGILLHSICSQKKRHREDLISVADTKA